MGKKDWQKVKCADGRERWVDQQGIVQGVVRTGKRGEDAKEYAERSQVEKLLAHWGWPCDSEIERPGAATYDYDCVHPVTGQRAAVEIKRVNLPKRAMNRLHSTSYARYTDRDLLALPAEHVAKANEQLKQAPSGVRRCVLLVFDLEPVIPALLSWWHLLVKVVWHLDMERHSSVDEVWLTTSHLTQFAQRRRPT